MTAKQELKLFRNYLRDWKRHMRNDPYIAEAAKNIEIRIERWSCRTREVLVVCRNLTLPATDYNSAATHYCWVYTSPKAVFKREIWMAVNQMLVDLRKDFQ